MGRGVFPAFLAVQHGVGLELADRFGPDALDVPLRQLAQVTGQIFLDFGLALFVQCRQHTGDIGTVRLKRFRQLRVVAHVAGDGVEDEYPLELRQDLTDAFLDFLAQTHGVGLGQNNMGPTHVDSFTRSLGSGREIGR